MRPPLLLHHGVTGPFAFAHANWGVACVAIALLIVSLSGCEQDRPVAQPATPPPAPSSAIAITSFCSDCHAMPNPTSFTKDRWHHEVRQGIDLYRKSLRDDLVIPDFEATLAWFRQYAPDELEFEELDVPSESESNPNAGRFRSEQIDWPGEGLVAGSHFVSLDRSQVNRDNDAATDFEHALAIADMGSGELWLARHDGDTIDKELIGVVANPAHIEPADLDADGSLDFLVADLGGFFPQRHRRGGLWWFRRRADATWQRVSLKMAMTRACDVRAADFDGDGDQDLVVAEFGWHFQGGINLLTNQGLRDGIPQFESTRLDDRPGGIHLPVCDLNQDGDPDFVALISQHHEAVVAFLGRGDGTFEKKTIYQAGDPAYGSSGIEMVDLDGDGDLDVLLTNGDTFDDEIPKPIHSVQWLENEGVYPFRHHPIGQMPGAYRAVSGDVDGDGDTDVLAVALLSKKNIADAGPGTFDGVTFFEQVDGKKFDRHRVQIDQAESATCRLLDWDGDGDLDLLTLPYSTLLKRSGSLRLFRNTSR